MPTSRRGSFAVYTAGSEGAVVLCLHGGGYTGLTWSLVAQRLKARCARAASAAFAWGRLPLHSLGFSSPQVACARGGSPGEQGSPSKHNHMQNQARVPQNQTRYRVVAPDLRGHGASQTEDDFDFSAEVGSAAAPPSPPPPGRRSRRSRRCVPQTAQGRAAGSGASAGTSHGCCRATGALTKDTAFAPAVPRSLGPPRPARRL